MAGGSWATLNELRSLYWNDDPKERRRLLFPWIWGTVAREGQIFGNRTLGSPAEVTNGLCFSYPGYNEMSSGVADPRIDSNEFGPNPNATVFEFLNAQPALRGKVEVFGTWATFHEIFDGARSGLRIRAGKTLVDASDHSPPGRLFEELYQTTTRLEGDDSFLHVALREHLKTHRPQVLFVGYGDTDSWAHSGRYDLLLDSAHHVDAFIGDLWAQMQALPEYRGNTTFIITTDHGRGSGPVEWKEHGVNEAGSGNVWIAVIGPGVAALGERQNTALVTQSQIASTIAAIVGYDYRKAKPAAAAPLTAAFGAPAAR